MKIGLGFLVNDGDEAQPGQKGWGGLGPHAIVFGKTPGETALITLGGPAAAVPTISQWGLIIMALLILTSGAVVIGRRRRMVPG